MNPDVRALFPGASEQPYFDISANSLMAEPVRAAIERHLGARTSGRGDKTEMVATVNRARASFASLIGASSDEVAITKNVSDGLNLFGASLPWRAGDNVVLCPALEHPNNIYLWYSLVRTHGIEVRSVAPEDGHVPVAAMAAAMDERTRLVTIPSITFAPGFVTDMKAIAAAARGVGALTLVDAAQSVGAHRTDVDDLGVDALAVAAQKALLSVYGFGFLYVRREVAETLTPVHVARFGIELDAHETAYSDDELRFRPGALRFDVGNYNYLGAAATDAALDLLSDWGVGRVERHVRGLAADLAKRAAGPRPPGRRREARTSPRTPRLGWRERRRTPLHGRRPRHELALRPPDRRRHPPRDPHRHAPLLHRRLQRRVRHRPRREGRSSVVCPDTVWSGAPGGRQWLLILTVPRSTGGRSWRRCRRSGWAGRRSRPRCGRAPTRGRTPLPGLTSALPCASPDSTSARTKSNSWWRK